MDDSRKVGINNVAAGERQRDDDAQSQLSGAGELWDTSGVRMSALCLNVLQDISDAASHYSFDQSTTSKPKKEKQKKGFADFFRIGRRSKSKTKKTFADANPKETKDGKKSQNGQSAKSSQKKEGSSDLKEKSDKLSELGAELKTGAREKGDEFILGEGNLDASLKNATLPIKREDERQRSNSKAKEKSSRSSDEPKSSKKASKEKASTLPRGETPEGKTGRLSRPLKRLETSIQKMMGNANQKAPVPDGLPTTEDSKGTKSVEADNERNEKRMNLLSDRRGDDKASADPQKDVILVSDNFDPVVESAVKHSTETETEMSQLNTQAESVIQEKSRTIPRERSPSSSPRGRARLRTHEERLRRGRSAEVTRGPDLVKRVRRRALSREWVVVKTTTTEYTTTFSPGSKQIQRDHVTTPDAASVQQIGLDVICPVDVTRSHEKTPHGADDSPSSPLEIPADYITNDFNNNDSVNSQQYDNPRDQDLRKRNQGYLNPEQTQPSCDLDSSEPSGLPIEPIPADGTLSVSGEVSSEGIFSKTGSLPKAGKFSPYPVTTEGKSDSKPVSIEDSSKSSLVTTTPLDQATEEQTCSNSVVPVAISPDNDSQCSSSHVQPCPIAEGEDSSTDVQPEVSERLEQEAASHPNKGGVQKDKTAEGKAFDVGYENSVDKNARRPKMYGYKEFESNEPSKTKTKSKKTPTKTNPVHARESDSTTFAEDLLKDGSIANRSPEGVDGVGGSPASQRESGFCGKDKLTPETTKHKPKMAKRKSAVGKRTEFSPAGSASETHSDTQNDRKTDSRIEAEKESSEDHTGAEGNDKDSALEENSFDLIKRKSTAGNRADVSFGESSLASSTSEIPTDGFVTAQSSASEHLRESPYKSLTESGIYDSNMLTPNLASGNTTEITSAGSDLEALYPDTQISHVVGAQASEGDDERELSESQKDSDGNSKTSTSGANKPRWTKRKSAVRRRTDTPGAGLEEASGSLDKENDRSVGSPHDSESDATKDAPEKSKLVRRKSSNKGRKEIPADGSEEASALQEVQNNQVSAVHDSESKAVRETPDKPKLVRRRSSNKGKKEVPVNGSEEMSVSQDGGNKQTIANDDSESEAVKESTERRKLVRRKSSTSKSAAGSKAASPEMTRKCRSAAGSKEGTPVLVRKRPAASSILSPESVDNPETLNDRRDSEVPPNNAGINEEARRRWSARQSAIRNRPETTAAGSEASARSPAYDKSLATHASESDFGTESSEIAKDQGILEQGTVESERAAPRWTNRQPPVRRGVGVLPSEYEPSESSLLQHLTGGWHSDEPSQPKLMRSETCEIKLEKPRWAKRKTALRSDRQSSYSGEEFVWDGMQFGNEMSLTDDLSLRMAGNRPAVISSGKPRWRKRKSAMRYKRRALVGLNSPPIYMVENSEPSPNRGIKMEKSRELILESKGFNEAVGHSLFNPKTFSVQPKFLKFTHDKNFGFVTEEPLFGSEPLMMGKCGERLFLADAAREDDANCLKDVSATAVHSFVGIKRTTSEPLVYWDSSESDTNGPECVLNHENAGSSSPLDGVQIPSDGHEPILFWNTQINNNERPVDPGTPSARNTIIADSKPGKDDERDKRESLFFWNTQVNDESSECSLNSDSDERRFYDDQQTSTQTSSFVSCREEDGVQISGYDVEDRDRASGIVEVSSSQPNVSGNTTEAVRNVGEKPFVARSTESALVVTDPTDSNIIANSSGIQRDKATVTERTVPAQGDASSPSEADMMSIKSLNAPLLQFLYIEKCAEEMLKSSNKEVKSREEGSEAQHTAGQPQECLRTTETSKLQDQGPQEQISSETESMPDEITPFERVVTSPCGESRASACVEEQEKSANDAHQELNRLPQVHSSITDDGIVRPAALAAAAGDADNGDQDPIRTDENEDVARTASASEAKSQAVEVVLSPSAEPEETKGTDTDEVPAVDQTWSSARERVLSRGSRSGGDSQLRGINIRKSLTDEDRSSPMFVQRRFNIDVPYSDSGYSETEVETLSPCSVRSSVSRAETVTEEGHCESGTDDDARFSFSFSDDSATSGRHFFMNKPGFNLKSNSWAKETDECFPTDSVPTTDGKTRTSWSTETLDCGASDSTIDESVFDGTTGPTHEELQKQSQRQKQPRSDDKTDDAEKSSRLGSYISLDSGIGSSQVNNDGFHFEQTAEIDDGTSEPGQTPTAIHNTLVLDEPTSLSQRDELSEELKAEDAFDGGDNKNSLCSVSLEKGNSQVCETSIPAKAAIGETSVNEELGPEDASEIGDNKYGVCSVVLEEVKSQKEQACISAATTISEVKANEELRTEAAFRGGDKGNRLSSVNLEEGNSLEDEPPIPANVVTRANGLKEINLPDGQVLDCNVVSANALKKNGYETKAEEVENDLVNCGTSSSTKQLQTVENPEQHNTFESVLKVKETRVSRKGLSEMTDHGQTITDAVRLGNRFSTEEIAETKVDIRCLVDTVDMIAIQKRRVKVISRSVECLVFPVDEDFSATGASRAASDAQMKPISLVRELKPPTQEAFTWCEYAELLSIYRQFPGGAGEMPLPPTWIWNGSRCITNHRTNARKDTALRFLEPRACRSFSFSVPLDVFAVIRDRTRTRHRSTSVLERRTMDAAPCCPAQENDSNLKHTADTVEPTLAEESDRLARVDDTASVSTKKQATEPIRNSDKKTTEGGRQVEATRQSKVGGKRESVTSLDQRTHSTSGGVAREGATSHQRSAMQKESLGSGEAAINSKSTVENTSKQSAEEQHSSNTGPRTAGPKRKGKNRKRASKKARSAGTNSSTTHSTAPETSELGDIPSEEDGCVKEAVCTSVDTNGSTDSDVDQTKDEVASAKETASECVGSELRQRSGHAGADDQTDACGSAHGVTAADAASTNPLRDPHGMASTSTDKSAVAYFLASTAGLISALLVLYAAIRMDYIDY